ncbi:MAG: rhodanese-like domain-containing protein [Hyphomicrobiaceae bacterium]|nr:rhodanese-like domain-containing protein [Hyphomicrobiaceae bacterium]
MSDGQRSAGLGEMTPQQVAELYDAGKIMLVDVRTPMEYAFEHIKGALNLPMAFLDPSKLPRQADKLIVFHCGSGKRSKMVAEKCLAAGHPTVTHMVGGFTEWKKAKLPYLGTNMATGAPMETKDQ